MPSSADWHRRWLEAALLFASWSKDPSTKVGAVLVRDGQLVASGYNGFPRNVVDSPERLSDRETKYQWTVHAEMNVLLQAAFHGHSTRGCVMYATQMPCSRCATSIIQAGIPVIVVDGRFPTPERWARDAETSKAMFLEAGVVLVTHHW